MKTHPINHPTPEAPPLAFNPRELSFADTLTLDKGTEGKEHPPLVIAFYLATRRFREGKPFKLWSEYWSQPLIESDGKALAILPAVRPFLAEFDSILTAEQQIGAQLARAQIAPPNEAPAPGPRAAPEPLVSPRESDMPEARASEPNSPALDGQNQAQRRRNR